MRSIITAMLLLVGASLFSQYIDASAWSEYKEACYNDSVLVYMDRDVGSETEAHGILSDAWFDFIEYIEPGGWDRFIDTWNTRCKEDKCGGLYLYLHRQPSFVGYMDWLDSRPPVYEILDVIYLPQDSMYFLPKEMKITPNGQ